MLRIIKDEIKLNKTAIEDEKVTGSIKVEVFRDDACINSIGTVEFKAIEGTFHTEVNCEKDEYALHMIAYTVFSLIQEYFDYRKLDSKCYLKLINDLAKVVDSGIQAEMIGLLSVLKDNIKYQTNKPDCELVSSTIISTLYPKFVEAEAKLGIE